MKMYKHPASGVELCREIAQPHVETFTECFDAVKPWDYKTQQTDISPRSISGQAIAKNLFDDCKAIMQGKAAKSKHPDQSMQVGPYCHVSQQDCAFAVRCADWVLSRIREKTIIVENDRMSFEIVNHDNGWSLVIANHGSILGSVWLAYIRTETIPTEKGGHVCN